MHTISYSHYLDHGELYSVVNVLIQYKLLNVISLGKVQGENPMITITWGFYSVTFGKDNFEM